MPTCFLCNKKAIHWIVYKNNIICTDEIHDGKNIEDPVIKAYLITLFKK